MNAYPGAAEVARALQKLVRGFESLGTPRKLTFATNDFLCGVCHDL